MTIRLSCATCHEEYLALGYTDEAIEAAVLRGPGCCPTDPSAAEDLGKTPAAGDHFPIAAALVVAGLAIWILAVLGTALGLVMSAVT